MSRDWSRVNCICKRDRHFITPRLFFQIGALYALKNNDATTFSSILADEAKVDDVEAGYKSPGGGGRGKVRSSLSDDEKKTKRDAHLLPIEHWVNQVRQQLI